MPIFRLPVSPLRRRLELTQLIAGLLDQEPDLAPRSALFDLADSLARLMDEMQGEGVAPETLRKLDVSDQSGHWQRSLRFVNLVEEFFGADSGRAPDTEARQRLVIETLTERWAMQPPTHPVLVAGSTGSRGATAMFMRAVSRLPQGAVILPGVDFDMPGHVWDRLDDADDRRGSPAVPVCPAAARSGAFAYRRFDRGTTWARPAPHGTGWCRWRCAPRR